MHLGWKTKQESTPVRSTPTKPKKKVGRGRTCTVAELHTWKGLVRGGGFFFRCYREGEGRDTPRVWIGGLVRIFSWFLEDGGGRGGGMIGWWRERGFNRPGSEKKKIAVEQRLDLLLVGKKFKS